jgi:predicted DNA-binding transcriptional regulator YafY
MARGTSAERAARLLAILHLLKPGARISLDAIAATLGVTRAEATEDIEALSCCGLTPYTPDALVPVLVEGEVAYVYSALPALTRSIRLSEAETKAVLAALRAAGLPADDPLCAKLAATSSDGDIAGMIERVLTASAAEGAQAVLKTTAVATEQRHVLRFTYQGLAEESPRERIVEPVALVNERGHWYLEGYARDSGALRTFRLDRVQDAEVLTEGVPERSIAPSGVALVTEGLPRATVRLAPGEEVTPREWPGVKIVSSDPSGTIVTVPYAGTAWIARQVAARLGAAEVVSPTEVRGAVRDFALAAADEP